MMFTVGKPSVPGHCQWVMGWHDMWVSSGPHKCNTTAIQEYFVLHLCGPLQYNAAIQLFYHLPKTRRLLAAVVKKLILQLYCVCADCCNTTEFLCYVIVVVLHLCGPL